jgi:hypothetical protein
MASIMTRSPRALSRLWNTALLGDVYAAIGGNETVEDATMHKIRSHSTIRAAAVAACALCTALFATAALATFHTWQIAELYSSADGTVQFIELFEAANSNGQDLLMSHTLTSSQGVTTRTFTFPSNLPNALTASKRMLIATSGFASLGVVTPDYSVPTPFLFPGGGTLDFAGVDAVTYPALPTDGVSSIDRSGNRGTNSPTNYAGQTGSIGPAPPPPVPPGPANTNAIPALSLPALILSAVLLLIAGGIARRASRAKDRPGS